MHKMSKPNPRPRMWFSASTLRAAALGLLAAGLLTGWSGVLLAGPAPGPLILAQAAGAEDEGGMMMQAGREDAEDASTAGMNGRMGMMPGRKMTMGGGKGMHGQGTMRRGAESRDGGMGGQGMGGHRGGMKGQGMMHGGGGQGAIGRHGEHSRHFRKLMKRLDRIERRQILIETMLRELLLGR